MLPSVGHGLDVACGRGRHALWLAHHGFATVAVDSDMAALQSVRAAAGAMNSPASVSQVDLEAGGIPFEAGAFNVVVVVHYLHRPLFPELRNLLAPGGVLVYETFTRRQAERGRPTNPAFLLEEGELLRLVHPLEIMRWREGERDGRFVASVIARRASSR